MTFDSDNLRHPYAAPRDIPSDRTTNSVPRKHSGLGIASFVIAIVAGTTAFSLIVTAGVMEATTPGGMDEDAPLVILVGLGIVGAVALGMLGAGLGVAGLVQTHRLRTFAVLGLVFNMLVVLGLVGLIAIGLSMDV